MDLCDFPVKIFEPLSDWMKPTAVVVVQPAAGGTNEEKVRKGTEERSEIS